MSGTDIRDPPLELGQRAGPIGGQRLQPAGDLVRAIAHGLEPFAHPADFAIDLADVVLEARERLTQPPQFVIDGLAICGCVGAQAVDLGAEAGEFVARASARQHRCSLTLDTRPR